MSHHVSSTGNGVSSGIVERCRPNQRLLTNIHSTQEAVDRVRKSEAILGARIGQFPNAETIVRSSAHSAVIEDETAIGDPIATETLIRSAAYTAFIDLQSAVRDLIATQAFIRSAAYATLVYCQPTETHAIAALIRVIPVAHSTIIVFPYGQSGSQSGSVMVVPPPIAPPSSDRNRKLSRSTVES